MSASYLRDWQRRFYDNKAGYMEMATWDPFVDWDKNRMPELLCENALILGLKILYGRLEPHLAQVFLDQCIAMCNRIVSERTVQSDACIGSFPKNRGRVTRSLYYASALNGIQREDSELGAASQDFAEWCHNSCVSWDAQSQSYYLTAVRLALLAHDVERAWRLGEAKAKRGFRHQADLWQIDYPSNVRGRPIRPVGGLAVLSHRFFRFNPRSRVSSVCLFRVGYPAPGSLRPSRTLLHKSRSTDLLGAGGLRDI
jgi:hypothetical protein